MRRRNSFSVAPNIFPYLSASSSVLSGALNRICSSRAAISRADIGSRSDVVGVTCTISRCAALEARTSRMSSGLAA